MIVPRKRVFTSRNASLHAEPLCPLYTTKSGFQSLCGTHLNPPSWLFEIQTKAIGRASGQNDRGAYPN